jgi:putative membrane-bound dehydrogenase-like protein
MKKLLPLIALLMLCACGGEEKTQTIAKNDYDKLSDAEKRHADNALAGLETKEGLVTQLFAAEPKLMNPTNLDVDSKGRIWVCEGYNYRMHLNPNNPVHNEGDRIIILEDKNGDGVSDETKVFYQGTDVNSALGICVLGNKVIVSCSPNIFVLTDTNGDDKADTKEILFKTQGGFQHDHAVHAVSFGHDGKLYFNFGNDGKALLDKDSVVINDQFGRPIIADTKLYQEGMVFRCDLDGKNVEVLGYNFRNNYEVAMDSYGTLWQSDNDDDGNKGVRINYVMEYGNFGFKDQMTGASWQARRTNLEKEIPLRHWHLNDPGVVPNLLQTGAGSPTGLLVYEGNLLPQEFQNQVIHCDAGPNVVRAYPVTNDGAGYKATMVNILQGTKDQWFRPADVCVAPDGSLIVADWYDPGVGGHQVGDLDRGRLYRITVPDKQKYEVPAFDLSTPEKAIEALKSPNMATRYLAWTKLNEMQEQAEPALANVWENDANPRMKARALWLLSKIKGKGENYVNEALKSENLDLKMAGIRAGKELKMNLLPAYQTLTKDASPQVRREVALALRNNKAPEAAEIWAELATQHNGDRWYLEALGIGADEQWDSFLEAYLKRVGEDWNKDIIWRSRAKKTPTMLAKMIQGSKGEEKLRYFRAFDFQKDNAKQNVLLTLFDANHAEQGEIDNLVLRHLDKNVPKTPKLKKALDAALVSTKGTLDFVDLVNQFELKDQYPALMELIFAKSDSVEASEGAKILMKKGGKEMLGKALKDKNNQKVRSTLNVLGKLDSEESRELISSVMNNEEYEMATRALALEKYGAGWGGQEQLWKLVKESKLKKDLEPTAKQVLTTAWRADIKSEASKFYGGETAQETSPIAKLVSQTGDVSKGKAVYTQYCAQCHQVKGEGIDFGPKLSEIGTKLPKEGLYKSILKPNEGISFGYEGFVFKLKNGTTIVGVISSKTETDIDVKQVGGTVTKIQKSDIAEQKEYDGSLMPAFQLPEKELIDLVEYLSGLKKTS